MFFFNCLTTEAGTVPVPPVCMSLPIPSPREASLQEGPDAHQTKGFAAEGVLRGGHGCFLLVERLLLQVLKQNYSALIFPNKQKQFEQLGPGPPTPLATTTNPWCSYQDSLRSSDSLKITQSLQITQR